MGIIEEVLAKKKLSDLVIAEESSSVVPELVEAKVNDAITKLKEIEKWNGYNGISQEVGLSKEQVKQIHEKMKQRISELEGEAK